jgi:hypothetical protein
MSIGKIKSLLRLIDSNVVENQNLVFAIMQGPDITPKQKVKYLEYLYKKCDLYSLSDSLYTKAFLEFYEDILEYESRKRKIDGNKIVRV